MIGSDKIRVSKRIRARVKHDPPRSSAEFLLVPMLVRDDIQAAGLGALAKRERWPRREVMRSKEQDFMSDRVYWYLGKYREPGFRRPELKLSRYLTGNARDDFERRIPVEEIDRMVLVACSRRDHGDDHMRAVVARQLMDARRELRELK